MTRRTIALLAAPFALAGLAACGGVLPGEDDPVTVDDLPTEISATVGGIDTLDTINYEALNTDFSCSGAVTVRLNGGSPVNCDGQLNTTVNPGDVITVTAGQETSEYTIFFATH